MASNVEISYHKNKGSYNKNIYIYIYNNNT